MERPWPPSAPWYTGVSGLEMAAQRIRAANSGGLPRCKSEGTLIDLSEGFAETSLCDVKGVEGRMGTPMGWVGTMPPAHFGCILSALESGREVG